jgi:hypothetical protein
MESNEPQQGQEANEYEETVKKIGLGEPLQINPRLDGEEVEYADGDSVVERLHFHLDGIGSAKLELYRDHNLFSSRTECPPFLTPAGPCVVQMRYEHGIATPIKENSPVQLHIVFDDEATTAAIAARLKCELRYGEQHFIGVDTGVSAHYPEEPHQISYTEWREARPTNTEAESTEGPAVTLLFPAQADTLRAIRIYFT